MRWENVWGRRALADSSGHRAPVCLRKGGLRLLLSRQRAQQAAPLRLPSPWT